MTPSPPAPSSADPAKIREKKENAPGVLFFWSAAQWGICPAVCRGGVHPPRRDGAVGNGGASRRRPLRNSIDKRSVGVGLPDDPHRSCTVPSRQGTWALPYKELRYRAGRTESSAPTNRSVGAGVPDGPLSPAAMLSVGRGALTPPPGLAPHFHVKSLSLRGRNAPVAIRSFSRTAFQWRYFGDF